MNSSKNSKGEGDDGFSSPEDKIDPDFARNVYTANFPFMEDRKERLESYIPEPSELAALAARLFPSILSWRLGPSHGGKTAQPTIEEVGREAVHAALQIAKVIREGANVELYLERRLRAGYEKEAPILKAKEKELRQKVWEPLAVAHRKRHNLAKDAEVVKVDLDLYLGHVMPKLRGGDKGRRERFVAFLKVTRDERTREDREGYKAELARFQEREAAVRLADPDEPNQSHGRDSTGPVWRPEWNTPTDDEVLSSFASGVPYLFLDWNHEAFQQFCLDWANHRRKEGGRKGGRASKKKKVHVKRATSSRGPARKNSRHRAKTAKA